MLASFLLLADAAEEGRKVVLSMLAVGLIFLLVIAIGELDALPQREAQGPHAQSHAVEEAAMEERIAASSTALFSARFA